MVSMFMIPHVGRQSNTGGVGEGGGGGGGGGGRVGGGGGHHRGERKGLASSKDSSASGTCACSCDGWSRREEPKKGSFKSLSKRELNTYWTVTS